MIPRLKLDFAPKQGISETVVRRMIQQLDGRKNIDYAAATRVLCGLIAMKGVHSFAVMRGDMTDEEKKVFDAIADAHYSVLLQRQSGLNNYRIREGHDKDCVVIDTLPRSLAFMVTGNNVDFQNNDAISTPEQIKLINGRHSVTVKMTDVANVFEFFLRGAALPVRFKFLSLVDGEFIISDDAIDLAQSYHENLSFWLGKTGHTSVFVNHANEPNEFWFACSDVGISTLQFTLIRAMQHWFKEHRLPIVHFPIVVSTFGGGVCDIQGDALQQNLEHQAGIR